MKLLGDKSIFFEDQISRIYPNENLYSHILGQIDDANNGISGLEKKFDFTDEYAFNKIYLWLERETCEECIDLINPWNTNDI